MAGTAEHLFSADRRDLVFSLSNLALAISLTIGSCAPAPPAAEDHPQRTGEDVPNRTFVEIIVSGDVADQTGLPVGGAIVRLSVFNRELGPAVQLADCAGVLALRPLEILSDSSGGFETRIVGGTAEFEACIVADVIPPEGSGLEHRTVSGIEASFTHEAESPESRVVLEIRLSHRNL